MENWGLITYRETSLLYKENESSAAAQQWVAIVVAHELAHQWFGNLVTIQWWNDLWTFGKLSQKQLVIQSMLRQ